MTTYYQYCIVTNCTSKSTWKSLSI